MERGQIVNGQWAEPGSYFLEGRNLIHGAFRIEDIPRTIRREGLSIIIEDHFDVAIPGYDKQATIHDKGVSGEYKALDNLLKKFEGGII